MIFDCLCHVIIVQIHQFNIIPIPSLHDQTVYTCQLSTMQSFFCICPCFFRTRTIFRFFGQHTKVWVTCGIGFPMFIYFRGKYMNMTVPNLKSIHDWHFPPVFYSDIINDDSYAVDIQNKYKYFGINLSVVSR